MDEATFVVLLQLFKELDEGDEGDSLGAEDGSDEEDKDHQVNMDEEHRRRIVYEVKAGKVKQLNGGIAAWETTLEKKLTKAGLL